jgi:exodeoxyribonuclease VII large subunit
MAFNDENMAMEVYHATIPVISAIGHETDTTIIYYVSDLRVSTPTAAAEKAVPMLTELVQSVDVISQRLENCIEIIFYNIKIKLENLSKFIKAPSFIIKSYKEKFKLIAENLYRELIYLLEINYKKLEKKSQFIVSKNFDLNIKKKYLKNIAKNLNYYLINKKIYQQKELNKFSRLLESNSINLTLKKGYTIVRKSKKIIKNPNLINQKDKINIQFKSRAIDIIVKKI